MIGKGDTVTDGNPGWRVRALRVVKKRKSALGRRLSKCYNARHFPRRKQARVLFSDTSGRLSCRGVSKSRGPGVGAGDGWFTFLADVCTACRFAFARQNFLFV